MIPQIQRELVDKRKWVEEADFINSILVTQSVPGPVVVNLSIYLGYNFSGLLGVAACLLGVILPSFIIILIIAMSLSHFIDHPLVIKAFMGIRPAVVGLIVYAAFKLARNFKWSVGTAILLVLSFLVNVFLGVSPIIIIVASLVIGVITFYIQKNRPPKRKQTKNKLEGRE